jgi:hypothetical protein
MKKHLTISTLLLLSIVCLSAQTVPESNYFYSEISGLMTQYNADVQTLQKVYIADHAPERSERLKKLHQDYLSRLKKVLFTNLSRVGQIDYLLFKRDLNQEISNLEQILQDYNRLKTALPFAENLYEIERTHRRGKVVDGKAIAIAFNESSKQIRGLMQGTSTRALVQDDARFVQITLQGIKKAIEKFYTFYYNYDPLFTWWVEKPYSALVKDLDAYAKWMVEKADTTGQLPKDKSGIAGQPIGEVAILAGLKYEMIPYSPTELIAIAEKEFAWCRKEMLKASSDMGFGDRWKDAMEKVKNTYVPPGEQPALINRLYNESVDFLKKQDLVTMPALAEEDWRMSMMSPERQLVNPFFLGGEQIIISYPTNTMEHEDKLMSLRGNNPHFSRAVVHHELNAGHHLQQFMNRRYRPYRDFNTAFWTEGWALYWELLLWDLKFPQSPEDRVGMLFWRMHRCARIIFSLNYHLKTWTPQQCIDFLVEEVNHERANAEGEVRRSFEGRYNPLYQLAYMIGGLQFWALKQELVDSKKMTYKQFHDAVLKENNIPVEMVRAALTQIKLTENYDTNWRFYKIEP